MNDLQRAFVREYLVDLNAEGAARRAGYFPKTARANSYKLLSDPTIAAAIATAQAERAQRTEITADRVLAELAAMAFFDPADLARTPLRGPEDIAALPEPVRRAILGWSWDKDGRFVLKLSPKTPSLDLLGRHLGMFRDKLEVTGKDGGPVEVEHVRERIARRLAGLAGARREG